MHNDGKTWLLISPHYDKLCLKEENSRQLLRSHYSGDAAKKITPWALHRNIKTSQLKHHKVILLNS